MSNINCALFPTRYAISHLYLSPVCCRRASTSFHFPAHPSKSISDDMSGKPHPPVDGVQCPVPCTSSLPYTHILALFTFVLNLDISLSFWTVSSWTRVKDHLIPLCGDSACQEGGLINYELKLTLAFRFRINEMKSTMI